MIMTSPRSARSLPVWLRGAIQVKGLRHGAVIAGVKGQALCLARDRTVTAREYGDVNPPYSVISQQLPWDLY